MAQAPPPTPFTLHVSDDTLSDLKERLARTRWPDEPPLEPWSTGTSLAYMQRAGRLLARRLRLARAGSAAQPRSASSPCRSRGIDLHFIHEPGRGPAPMPLLLSHGWPGSVLEFTKLIPLLTDPARFGGDPADAFTVVAPSLPGYTLSFRPGPAALRQSRRSPTSSPR